MGTERGVHEIGDGPLIQADLFNDELPPSVPDRRPMTAEEVEKWIADLPF